MIDLCILSHSSTAEALPYCYQAFEKNWPGWREIFRVSVFCEEHPEDFQAPFAHWRWFECGDVPMGTVLRSIPYFDKTIETCLLWLDDYLLVDVDLPLFYEAWGIFSANKWMEQLRLLPCPGPDEAIFHKFGKIDPESRYSVSLQAAFWRPTVFQHLVGNQFSPWDVEITGSAHASAVSYARHFVGCYESILGYKNMFRRGEMQQDVLEWAEKSLC